MKHTKYQGRYKNKVIDINITKVQKLAISRNYIEGISQRINSMLES